MAKWCSPLDPARVLDLPFKAGKETHLTAVEGAQLVELLDESSEPLGLRIPHPHIEVNTNYPNLPPNDYVYITTDVNAVHVETSKGVSVYSGEFVDLLVADLTIGSDNWKLEIVTGGKSNVGLAHLFPVRSRSTSGQKEASGYLGSLSSGSLNARTASGMLLDKSLNEAVKSTQFTLDNLVAAQRAAALTLAERDELDKLRLEAKQNVVLRAELEQARAEVRLLQVQLQTQQTLTASTRIVQSALTATSTSSTEAPQRRTPPQLRSGKYAESASAVGLPTMSYQLSAAAMFDHHQPPLSALAMAPVLHDSTKLPSALSYSSVPLAPPVAPVTIDASSDTKTEQSPSPRSQRQNAGVVSHGPSQSIGSHSAGKSLLSPVPSKPMTERSISGESELPSPASKQPAVRVAAMLPKPLTVHQPSTSASSAPPTPLRPLERADTNEEPSQNPSANFRSDYNAPQLDAAAYAADTAEPAGPDTTGHGSANSPQRSSQRSSPAHRPSVPICSPAYDSNFHPSDNEDGAAASP
ncbi:hypothetical protein DIPPA_35269 [Diplonema papillatum]|nr:hypothetical protein DIPPA_35269 [Diplonema papillatum]